MFEQQQHQEERTEKKGIISERIQEKFIEIMEMSFHIGKPTKAQHDS